MSIKKLMPQISFRKYGNRPFNVAVIHGGPGALGEMAPVAKALSHHYGVIEPLQTVTSLAGQIAELHQTLVSQSNTPITLIGFSWGAFLGFIFTARYPQLVKKLMLIGSGPYQNKYVPQIMATRLSRLNEHEKKYVLGFIKSTQTKNGTISNKEYLTFGNMLSRADAFEPLPENNKLLKCDFKAYAGVWSDFVMLRKKGALLRITKKITCPVVAIHGDYDPHPPAGVYEPLKPRLKKFKFILLKKCGHKPWIEKHAKKEFYNVLNKEI